MAVTVIFGKAGSGKTGYCFKEMKEWADRGGKALLIVPDQATYSIERRFAEYMPGQGFAGIQIVGFSRLAFRVFQERGQEHASLSELARKIVLQRLLRRCGDDLTVLKTAAEQANFAATAGQFILECRSFCVTPDMLRQAAENVGGPTLARKLQDIALVYEGYGQFLEERFGSSDDTMALLAREIPHYTFMDGARIWVDGFQWFTPQQLQVLQAAEGVADSLILTLTLDAGQLERQARETALFHRAYEVYRQVRRIFPALETKSLTTARRGPLEAFFQDFFAVFPKTRTEPVEGLSVISYARRDVEADGIGRRILQLCRQGYRYRDILVLARDSDLYTHLMERIFRDYGIPCFTDYRRPMLEHPAAALVSALLEVLQSHWAYEPLFRLLKTDLFPLPRHDVDILENYCLAYGIRGTHWLRDAAWEYGRQTYPDGSNDEDIEARLARINEIRRIVRDLLLPLTEEARQDHTVRQWCTLLYEWLVQAGVPEALRRWQEGAEQAALPMEGKEHEQVWKKLLLLLDELVQLCGDESVELQEFSQMAGDGLADLTFSMIPPTLDHVTVTAVERGYTMQARVVFLCGINDGVFPRHSSEEGLLNDAERQRLGTAGLSLGPGSRFRSLQERFLFYLSCTRAADKLFISYPLADEDGSALEPSSWIRQLGDKGYVSSIPYETGHVEEGHEADYLLALPAALRYLPEMLRPTLEGRPVADVWWALYDWAGRHGWKAQAAASVQGLFHRNIPHRLTPDLVRSLYAPDGELRGSVTRFESYRRCPFAYFAQYGLQIGERPIYSFAAPDLGLLVHGALCLLGKHLLAEKKQWRDIPDEAVEAVCREATEQMAPQIQHDILMSNAYFSHIKERLIQTLVRTVKRLCQFSLVSSFETTVLEKPFGRGAGAWAPLRFTLDNGLDVTVTGQIDRIDTLQEQGTTYIVVIDYKSGRVQLDPSQIYYGLELQLLAYMYTALLNMGSDAIPAAVLYCYVRNDKSSASMPLPEEEKADLYGKKSKMNGFYLQDGPVLQELDKSMNGYSSYLNLFVKGDGTFRKGASGIHDQENWQALLELACRRIRRIAAQMADGDISIHPFWLGGTTPCKYCPYHSVCQFDPQLQENRYDVLEKLSGGSLIEKIKEEGDDSHGMD